MLIFCSAGIGRTGTFIAIDMLARFIQDTLSEINVGGRITESRVEEEDHVYANLSNMDNLPLPDQNRRALEQSTEDVDIYGTVLWLRSQRRFLVQKDVSCIYLRGEYPAFEE